MCDTINSMEKWYFQKIARGRGVTEPTQEQFFNWESIKTPGRAVVREGIQNALDARMQSKGKAEVSITVVNKTFSEAKKIFASDWWAHIQAQQNGIVHHNVPQNSGTEAQKFLIFEDFNTTGLTGDEKHPFAKTDEGNNFYNFFRAVGSTDKVGTELGKWGIGKHTFWAASRVKTVFGFTVKDGEDEMLCLGKTILKSHAINESIDKNYQDGYYGITEDGSTEDRLVLPLRGDGALNLAKAFGLKRTTESGLSLVVPWVDDRINVVDIQKSVVEDYFYPILAGQLEVSLKSGTLDSNNIEDYTIEGSTTRKLILLGRDLMAHVEKGDMTVIEPPNRQKPKWEDVMFDDAQLNAIRKDYLAGKTVSIKVGVDITERGSFSSSPSYFHVAIKHIDESEKPCFIRDGIIIPDVKAKRVSSTLSLVVAEHSDLAKFLGKSENPSHTQWQPALLKDTYENASGVIGFVADSVRSIVAAISNKDTEKDEHALSDIFPFPIKSSSDEPEKSKKTEKPEVNPPTQPKMCIIQRVAGGFKVNGGSKLAPLGSQLYVQVAYNVRKGNALKKYNKEDFQLNTLDIKYDGLRETNKQLNCLSAIIDHNEFSLHVTGFDPNRDLYVRANVNPNSNEEAD